MDGSEPRLSAATPLVSNLQTKLVTQIDQGVNYDKIYATVIEMAQELSSQNAVKVQDMLEVLREDAGSQMTLLLHTIPRPVLRSIVMRMVAYDFWDRDSDNRKLLYNGEGPGAYIATLSVIGRYGCTWSINENKKIIGLLKQYALAIEAAEKYDDFSGSQYTDEERTAMKVATNIDKAYLKDDDLGDAESDTGSDLDSCGAQTWEIPRFARSSKTNKSRFVQQLILTLEQRNISNVDVDEPSKQSVCMVGNSDDVEKRKQSHRLITSLKNTAHCWGLLVSCLKYAGLEAEETIIPVCKAWKLEHINMAEILLTVLTGSLISVGGLNVKQPGTKSERNPPSDRIFESGRRHVWGAKPWFEENMAYSNPPLKRLMDAERELEDMEPDAPQKSVAEVEQLEEEIKEKLAELDAIEKRQAEDQKILDKAEEIAQFCTDNPDIIDALSFFS